MYEFLVTTLEDNDFYIVMCDEEFLKKMNNITYKRLEKETMDSSMEKNLIASILSLHKKDKLLPNKELTDI